MATMQKHKNRSRVTKKVEDTNKGYFFNRCMAYTYGVAKAKEARVK